MFKDLELQKNLEARDSDPKCAVYVIDLQSGGISEWIELSGHITELFDNAVIAGCRCPSSVPLQSPNIASFITIDGRRVSAGEQAQEKVPKAAVAPA